MKRILAIATLLLAAGSTVPAQAASDSGPETPGDRSFAGRTVQTEATLIADSRVDRAWDEYRDRRHRELDRQMKDEMNKPHNSRLSQRQKEDVIRDAHRALDKQLDREEKDWKRRHDRDSRDDRFDRDYGNRRNDRNNRRDYDYRRDDDRRRSDDYYRVDPQNPYEQYRRGR